MLQSLDHCPAQVTGDKKGESPVIFLTQPTAVVITETVYCQAVSWALNTISFNPSFPKREGDYLYFTDRTLGGKVKQYKRDPPALQPGWNSQGSHPTLAPGKCPAVCPPQLLRPPATAGCGVDQFSGARAVLPPNHAPYLLYLCSRQGNV